MADDLETIKRDLEVKALQQKAPLEVTKLQLEIESLKRGFGRTLAVSVITAAITILIAVGGWTLDRWKTRAANRDSEAKHQDEVFAKVLDNFGSPNLATRMTAIISLTSFANDHDRSQEQVTAALVSRLSIAEDVPEIEQIVWALEKMAVRPYPSR